MVSTHLKNIGEFGSFPQVGVKIKNIWNHHLDYVHPVKYYTGYFFYPIHHSKNPRLIFHDSVCLSTHTLFAIDIWCLNTTWVIKKNYQIPPDYTGSWIKLIPSKQLYSNTGGRINPNALCNEYLPTLLQKCGNFCWPISVHGGSIWVWG